MPKKVATLISRTLSNTLALTQKPNLLKGKGLNSKNLRIVNLLNIANVSKDLLTEYEDKWVTPTVEKNAIGPKNLMKLQFQLPKTDKMETNSRKTLEDEPILKKKCHM